MSKMTNKDKDMKMVMISIFREKKDQIKLLLNLIIILLFT